MPVLPRILRPSALQTIKEVKATCACTLSGKPKPFAPWPSGMQRSGEPSQADSLQQRHAKSIQHLEEQVIQEEGKSQLDFLSTCQATIQASPVELHSHALVASYNVLMGQAQTCPTHLPSHKEPPLLSNHLPQWFFLLLCN